MANNRLKGGTTELTGGPWQVTGNAYTGTMPNTFTYCAFGTHYTRDLTLSNNRVQPSGPSGKTWRFLVMTQAGVGDVIAGNTVVGVGPMDTDAMPSPNASEVILTEAYTVHYEGMVSSVSPDGRTLQIFQPQGGQARTGDVVAILSGPQAGQWRTVAQVLNPTTYVLDTPVAPGRFAVSLVTGFVNETFQGNTEDVRGSSAAGDLVLVGNQFGVKVRDNTYLGGSSGFKITACPSQSPVTWGWTHAPLLGATIEGNTFVDTIHGGSLDVEHNAYATSDAGRVYFSGTFSDNTGIWTAPFLASQAAAGNPSPPGLRSAGLRGHTPARRRDAPPGAAGQAGRRGPAPPGPDHGAPGDLTAGHQVGRSCDHADAPEGRGPGAAQAGPDGQGDETESEPGRSLGAQDRRPETGPGSASPGGPEGPGADDTARTPGAQAGDDSGPLLARSSSTVGACGPLALVQDLLGDLALADLAPLPTVGPDGLVEVGLGDGDGAEPDLGLAIPGLFELGTSREMEEVRSRLDRGRALAVGDVQRDRAVEDVTDRFESRLRDLFGGFQGADPHMILNGHGLVPDPTPCGIEDYGFHRITGP
ncbi:MAG: hypothetical protein LC745_03255 [Planctomycetia bacterium]|nr:hypothetical protein [Planctomycetia bacterium]